MKLRELVNAHIRDLEPYPPGKPIEEVERELGIAGSIKLASNESPMPPSPAVLEAIARAAPGLNRYPDGSSYYLRHALADALQVAPDQLLFGAGSDEILELLAKTFLSAGDEVVCAWPSFAMYPIVARGMGATPVQVPLDADYRADVEALLAAVTPRTRLLLLANPNNPTGTAIGADAWKRLLEGVPDHVIVGADEAYLEYARRPDFPDSLGSLADHPTLVVLRTFSKAYGLAGARLGYAIGDPELIGYLERARHPFNVSSLAQVAARAALEDAPYLARLVALTHDGLRQLEAGLDALGVPYAQSDANFLLIEVGDDAAGLYERLMRRGVITRTLGAFGLTRHLRVTAGVPEENSRFLAALREELGA